MEQAVLGAIMLEKSAMDRVTDILKPESFYSDAHQKVFSAIKSLSAKGSPIDLLTVVEELTGSGDLDAVGGVGAVVRLTNSVVSSAHVEAHARVIDSYHVRREVIRAAGELINMGYDDGVSGKQLIEEADKAILRIGAGTLSTGILNMDDVMMQTLQKVDYWRNMGSEVTGVPSGFREIDYSTRGWQPGDLIILAARPSVGKTALSLNLSLNAALSGFGVAIWSLEMKAASMGLRMLSAQSEVVMVKLQTGKVTDDEMTAMHRGAVSRLAKLPIYFDDSSNLTMGRMRAVARRMVTKHKVGLFIIDYLQLMSGEGKAGNREQEISTISRSLKMLAMELNVPIIALSQLSREVEKRANRKPMLSDLRESGAIEQDADVVIFLYSDSEEAIAQDASLHGKRHICIAKQRNGSLITTDLDFRNEIQLFKNPSGYRPITETNPF